MIRSRNAVGCLPLLLVLLAGFDVQAQYSPGQQYPPGQYPQDPSGQYPPGGGSRGQNPAGGSGLPIPWKRNKNKKSAPAAVDAQPSFSAEGRTISNDGQNLVFATNDGRTITMAVTPRTQWTKDGSALARDSVSAHSNVHADAVEDREANLTAVKVNLLADTPEPATGEARTEARPSIVRATKSDADNDAVPNPTELGQAAPDPNRPIIRRGKPKGQSDSDSEGDETQTAAARPAAKQASRPKADPNAPADFTIDSDAARPKRKVDSNDLIARATDWVGSFSNGLPNFVCQQVTTRYMEESKSAGWQALDVVTAKVIYEEGHEKYQEITVGGHRTNKSMMELGGSTSTGEFASTLQSLFSPRSQAQFKFFRSGTVGTTNASIYDFKVALPNSDWTIQVGGQSLRPAYSGSVWIDKSTAEVRRIEMEAVNIPKDFPMDATEWSVDYDTVHLGTATFLLPTHAESLSCQRGSSICTKNTVEFRDYHKYTGESTVTFQ